MKNIKVILVLVLLVVVWAAPVPGSARGDKPSAKVITDFAGSPLSLEPSITAYPMFWKFAKPISVGGYGIYSTFDMTKDMIEVDSDGSIAFKSWICREDYCVMHCAGWHSFRRQFQQITDLSQADGIEITIEVKTPMRGYRRPGPESGNCNSRLRFVLCDRNWKGQNTLRVKEDHRMHWHGEGVVRDVDKRWDFDNQWVYDLPDSILYKEQTVTQKVPFSKLHKPDSDEEGSRIGSRRRFLPKETTAFEIAVIGDWKEFKITRVAAYKDQASQSD